MPGAAPIPADPSARRDFGVAWMNRGYALGQAGRLADAIAAYAQAIALLRTLPLDDNPSWANSLGAAWMNHGQLLHRAHGTTRAHDALVSFDEATAVLRTLPRALSLSNGLRENPWPRRNLAGTLLNRANLLLDLTQHAGASAAAREALVLCLPHERADPVDADLALKARRTLCDALGHLLVAPGADQEAVASEASDLVDDGLALARAWETRGESRLRSLAVRLFRYGAQLYRLHQPHFLVEFLCENLDPVHSCDALALTPELHAIAEENIAAALGAKPGQPYLLVADPASERWLGICRDLDTVRARLGSVITAA